jgi:hypothetical protein
MAKRKKKKGRAIPAEATPMEEMVGCPRGRRTGTTPVHASSISTVLTLIRLLLDDLLKYAQTAAVTEKMKV